MGRRMPAQERDALKIIKAPRIEKGQVVARARGKKKLRVHKKHK